MTGHDAELDSLIVQAREVLDANWTRHSTIPAPGLYPHQCNWHTGSIAIGRSRRHCQHKLPIFKGLR